MSELTDLKLNYLKATKQAIRNALIAKGQAVSSTDTFRSYAEKIAGIQGGGGGALICKYGTFDAEELNTEYVISHEVGAVPDLIILYHVGAPPVHAYVVMTAIGVTEEMAAKSGMFPTVTTNRGSSMDGKTMYHTQNTDMHQLIGLIRNVNEETFTVGSTVSANPQIGGETRTKEDNAVGHSRYRWFAVYGLV